MENVTTNQEPTSPPTSSGSRTPKSGATTPRSTNTAKRLSVFRGRRKSDVEPPSQLEVTDIFKKYSSHSASSSNVSSNPLSPREDLFFETSDFVKPFPDGAHQKTIVLQGCAEVGKSLIVKQLLLFEKGLDDIDDATTNVNNSNWRDEIRREMLDAIQHLAVEAEKQNLSIEEPYNLLGKDQNIRTLRNDILDSTVNPSTFFDTCFYLWNDPNIKEIVQKHERTVPIPRNIAHFFKDKETIEKISQFNYAPSVLDHLQSYEESQTVTVTETTIQNHKYKFIDTCGKERHILDKVMEQLLCFHHKSRKSVIPQSFELNPDYLSISAHNTQFWFVASLIDYDEKCIGNESKTRLMESLDAWDTSLSIWLKETQRPVVLVLTMYSMLREKWSKGFRFDGPKLANQIFGPNHCDGILGSQPFFFDDAVDFIAHLYLKKLELLCRQWTEERLIRICIVDATDRRTIAKLFTEVAEKYNYSSELVNLDNHIINFVKMANRDSMSSLNSVPLSPCTSEDPEEDREEEEVVVIETTDQKALFDAFQDQGPENPKPIFIDTFDPILAAEKRQEILKEKFKPVSRPPIPHVKSRSSGTYTPPPIPSRTVSVPILPLKDLKQEPISPQLERKSNSDMIFITSPTNSSKSENQQQESSPNNSGRKKSIFSQFKNLVKKAKDSNKAKSSSNGPSPPPLPSKSSKPRLIQGQENVSTSPKQEDPFKNLSEIVKKNFTFTSSSDNNTSLCSSIHITATYELSICNIEFKLDDGSTWKYDKTTNQPTIVSPHSNSHGIGAISSVVPTTSPSFLISTPRDWSKETNLKLIVQMDTLGKISKLKLVHNSGNTEEENFVFRMKKPGLDILDDWLLQRRRRGIDDPITLEDFLKVEDPLERFSTICCLKNYELIAK